MLSVVVLYNLIGSSSTSTATTTTSLLSGPIVCGSDFALFVESCDNNGNAVDNNIHGAGNNSNAAHINWAALNRRPLFSHVSRSQSQWRLQREREGLVFGPFSSSNFRLDASTQSLGQCRARYLSIYTRAVAATAARVLHRCNESRRRLRHASGPIERQGRRR